MASFSLLPTELVECIVSYLPQHDIYAVCRLNKALSNLATPFLYRHVDLFIPPESKLPRIDRFCLNIINDNRKADNVESIRLGLSPSRNVRQGQRWLPPDKNFDDQLMFRKAMTVLSDETLVAAGDYLRDAISMREYSAYAALILLVLPTLRRLDVADYKSATFDHLHNILRNLDPGTVWNRRYPSRVLLDRLSSIKQVSLMFDRITGVAYPGDNNREPLDHFLNIPSIETLELFSVGGRQNQDPIAAHLTYPLVRHLRATNITTLVFRHSGAFTSALHSLLQCTPKLRSLTYDFFFHSPLPSNYRGHLLMLDAWNEYLRPLAPTLEVLVFSAEYCDTSAYFFAQPHIGEKLHGYLDLTPFTALHTLEVPFPFLTGDVDLSITKEIYPLFPPNLRHLTLRPDLSHAHLPFPFDSSILTQGLTFAESKLEAQYLMNARMDVSYMFQASLTLLDFANPTTLESISVWQPADASLEWFDGQIKDFSTTCRNKGITGRVLKPMLLRWKKAEHWDLIKEITVFERKEPGWGCVERFWRGEWEGRPVGLGLQFHLEALRNGRVRLGR
jgi:hypothetical protein